MNLLVIGSDRNLFINGSGVQKRIKEYGKLFEELYVVVFTDRKYGYKNIKIADNVFIYPTNHYCKLLYLWNVYRIIKSLNIKFDIISSQDPFESGLAGWLLKKIYKIPLQLQIHTDFLSPYFARESLLNKIRVLLAKFLLLRADGIRVVSERIRESLNLKLGIFKSKIRVLPIFVDVESIKNAEVKVDLHKKYSQFNFIILMASRLTKEKNVDLAIEAMKEIIKNYPKVGLVIVGDGPEKENLYAISYQLSANVVFEPWTDDLSSYYKTADLSLLTSNYEGYGRTVIEAVAAGLPIVMTDVGLAGEVLINNSNGLVVPVGDKNRLISAVSFMIENKEKRDSFIKEAQKVVNLLGSKNDYLNMYKKSLNF